MSLLAYPFFHDVATTVGRFIQLQQQLESVQVQRRMRESWGQRTTVERAVSRVLKTFANWNTVQTTTSDPYVYHLSCVRQTTDSKLALWFIESLIQSARQAAGQNDRQIPLIDLIQSPAAFPFDLTSHAATLRRSDRFQVSHQGLDLEMVAPS
jgi:hypothetical protein